MIRTKIFWAKYEAHNEKTASWNAFFESEEMAPYLVDAPCYADVIVCSGGDGTLLKTVKHYIDYELPIYGVNAGTLGFLMNEVTQENFIDEVCIKQAYKVQKLNTIAVQVQERHELSTNEYYAFNDVCIGGDMSSWIEFNIESKVLPKNFMGGGLIFSTSQGSTGISKNNGGVIIPIRDNQWVVTGDKTNINLSTVIKPRKTKIEMSTRQSVTVWVDGNNKVIKDVESVILNKGPKVHICFNDFDGFVAKRYN